MAAMELGSMPSDCRRSAVSRGPSPASIRRKVPPASTRVVLPELPDPRTRKRTRQDHRPGHGRAGENPRPERFPKENRETLTPSLLVEVSMRRGAIAPLAAKRRVSMCKGLASILALALAGGGGGGSSPPPPPPPPPPPVPRAPITATGSGALLLPPSPGSAFAPAPE